MASLAPCSGCSRHVRVTEASCPFCGEALPLGYGTRLVARQRPEGRLGRAAKFAFGAAVAGAIASTGCGGDDDGMPPGEDGGRITDSGGIRTDAPAVDDDGREPELAREAIRAGRSGGMTLG